MLFAQPYRIQNFNVDEGLPSSFVYRVVPDSKGFMWILTDKGMARFDGKNFQWLRNDAGKSGNVIFAAGEDTHQRLWMYSSVRFFIYFDLKANRFHTLPNPKADPKKPGFFGQIFENTEGGIDFYAVNKMVYSLDKNLNLVGVRETSTQEYHFQQNYPQIDTTHIVYERKHDKDSLFYFKKPLNLPLPASITTYPTNYAASTLLADNHFFYRKGDKIVSFVDGKTFEKRITDLTKASKDKIDFRISGTGKPNLLFIRTPKEAFVIDAQLNRIASFDFLNDYSINTIYIDKNNNVWICTENKGLILCMPPTQKALPETVFPNMAIEALAVDKNGVPYVGNDLGEIHYFDKGAEKKLNIDHAPRLNIRNLYFDKKGQLFVSWRDMPHTLIPSQLLQKTTMNAQNNNAINYATLEGRKYVQALFDAKQLQIVNTAEVKALTENSKGEIYYVAGTDMRRLISTDKGWESHLLFTTRAYDMCNDSEGNMWLARYDGLFGVKNDKLDSLNALKKEFPLLTKAIFNLCVDNKGRFWFAHDDFNFYYLNPKNKHLIKIPELKNDIISGIHVDIQGRVWVATNNGVVCIEVQSENPFSYRFRRINRAHGLRSQDTHKIETDKDNLYVATSKGLTIFNLKTLFSPVNDTISLLPLAIKSLKINGVDTILRGYFDLPYDKNNIDIDFTCIHFGEQNPLQYEYRMVRAGSLDTAWRRIQEPHIELSYLPNGIFTLEIRALYDNDVVSVFQDSMQFNIRRPFWRTSWFVLGVLSILGVGVVAIYQFNIKKIKDREAEKAATSKRMATLEMQALQAQMNPHFIFNALTAIQNSIWNQDVKTANSFLARFSMLMRQFLEFSRQKFVTVEDEKSLLENYVELEKMRFPNRFDVNISIDDDLDPFAEIPSSMIQPFVENAINHGLLYKKEKGHLSVSFLPNGQYGVTCIVEDDGVGRQKAGEIQKQSQRTHRSQATQIIKEKTALLRKTADIDVDITIIDKNKEGSDETGTKVVIEFNTHDKK